MLCPPGMTVRMYARGWVRCVPEDLDGNISPNVSCRDDYSCSFPVRWLECLRCRKVPVRGRPPPAEDGFDCGDGRPEKYKIKIIRGYKKTRAARIINVFFLPLL